MWSLGWALIQHDWCPYKEDIETQAQKEGHVKTQGERGCPQAKERGLRRNQLS